MDKFIVLLLLLFPMAAPEGSYTLSVLASFIKGQTPFPGFSYLLLLNDVKVLYYNGDSDTFFARGNTTNEDSLIDPDQVRRISINIKNIWRIVDYLYKPKGIRVSQRLVLCDLKENDEPGEMFVWEGFQASNLNEGHFYNNTLDYTSQVAFNFEAVLELLKKVYYPHCIKTLRGYAAKRKDQVNRKVKPTVCIFHNPGGSQVTCLATGFYPRHINLTLFRDGQPVDDREVSKGDLLLNDDGTYQMRKILGVNEEEQRKKHEYTCTVTHISLDNNLDVNLEDDNLKPLRLLAILITTVFGLVLISVIIAVTVAPVSLWNKQSTGADNHVNSTDSGVKNDSMIKQN